MSERTADGGRRTAISTGPRGLSLAVSAWGADDGRPTVILHGYLEQGFAWDAVARSLPGRIVAPDHRGHGLSDHVGPGGFYHFHDYVADVDGLLEALSPNEPVDLVGHSMGGTVASLYAAQRAERVRKLVLVEGLGPPDAAGEAVQRGRQSLKHRREPPTHKPFPTIEDGIDKLRKANPEIPEDVARALVTRTTKPADGGWIWTWDPLHKARSPSPFSAATLMEHLRVIRAPVLVIYGGVSPYRAIPDLDAREACLADSRRVVIEGAGHMPHHSHPDVLAGEIEAFLRG